MGRVSRRVGVVPTADVGSAIGKEVGSNLGGSVGDAVNCLGGDGSATACCAIKILLEEARVRAMNELRSELEAVFAYQIVDVVAIMLDVLVEDLRIVVLCADSDRAEGDGLRGVEGEILPLEVTVAAMYFIDEVGVNDAIPVAKEGVVGAGGIVGGTWIGGAGGEGLVILEGEAIDAPVDAILAAGLIVDAAKIFIDREGLGEDQVARAAGQQRGTRDAAGLMLAFIRAEVPELFPTNGTAEGSTVLLVGERSDDVGDGIGGVEGVVAEVAERGAVEVVVAGLGLDINGDTGGAADGSVEAVSDDLELTDGVGREARLAEAGVCGVLSDLESIEIDLELAGVRASKRSVVDDGVDAHTGNEGGELHVVAAVDGQVPDVVWGDIACDGGGGSVDGHILGADDDGFGGASDGQHDVDGGGLADEHGGLYLHRSEVRGSDGDDVIACGERGNLIDAAGIGLGVDDGSPDLADFDGGVGDDGSLRVGDVAGDSGLLSV